MAALGNDKGLSNESEMFPMFLLCHPHCVTSTPRTASLSKMTASTPAIKTIIPMLFLAAMYPDKRLYGS